ncbi:hypothetical protein KCM76_23760 [Zooshikella marina]|uniref:hypothetical protein n=1 Tax=Zooshikella ganghwensis TaxID=202772 RepID=UPI001BAEB7AF|nr:hypothetical protein [Zooshikella ganghwensis]MBU2709033.1 hypothetical protein [Zooshikella ganghwensis]
MINLQNLLAIVLLVILSNTVHASKVYIEGKIFFGPEAMYFIECNSEERWWLSSPTFNAQGWKNAKKLLDAQPRCDLDAMPCKHQEVVVSGAAVITDEGSFGHLGKYPRQIYFTSIQAKENESICK